MIAGVWQVYEFRVTTFVVVARYGRGTPFPRHLGVRAVRWARLCSASDPSTDHRGSVRGLGAAETHRTDAAL